MQSRPAGRRKRRRKAIVVSVAALLGVAAMPAHSADPDATTDQRQTATPIRDDPYVPANSPAIGDLFDMFDFGHKAENGGHKRS